MDAFSPYRLALFVVFALLSACADGPPPNSIGSQVIPVVTVQTVQPKSLPVSIAVSGIIAAAGFANIRPQVGGIVQSRRFREDSDVKQGELLYQLDPVPYRAIVEAAASAVVKAEAEVRSVRRRARWNSELAAIGAESDLSVGDALLQAQAGLAVARAELRTARANLSATRITSPISGRIGKSSVEVGASVAAAQSKALATVWKLDKVLIPIPLDGLKPAEVSALGSAATRVRLLLEDGAAYPFEGKIVLPRLTGSLTAEEATARVEFPNPKYELLPGMMIQVTIDTEEADRVLLIPRAALNFDAAGTATALVVGTDGRLAQRSLTTGRVFGDLVTVATGLQAGDRIVVGREGNIRPGDTVQVSSEERASHVSATN